MDGGLALVSCLRCLPALRPQFCDLALLEAEQLHGGERFSAAIGSPAGAVWLFVSYHTASLSQVCVLCLLQSGSQRLRHVYAALGKPAFSPRSDFTGEGALKRDVPPLTFSLVVPLGVWTSCSDFQVFFLAAQMSCTGRAYCFTARSLPCIAACS